VLYFLILPAILGFLALLLGGALILRFLPDLRHLSGYLVGSAIGTATGFVLANGLLLLLVFGTLRVVSQPDLPALAEQLGGYGAAAGLIVGPIFASGAGVAVGLAMGVLFVFLKRRRRAI
jgi:hypothetical protein